MKAIFNSRIIDTTDCLIKTSNRAFCYGDGLFETIVTSDKGINLIDLHLKRLERGCDVLGLEFPDLISEKSLLKMITQLKEVNSTEGAVRTKLIVWRNEGGLYTPNQSSTSFYLESKAHSSPFYQGVETIGISESLHTLSSPISFAKTTNALTYVMAGQEKNKRNLDEIILTDAHGHLSETHISNLFWVKGNNIFTPSLGTGCIEGVMRTYLMNSLRDLGNPVKEVLGKVQELDNAQCIFTTNASGLRYFTSLQGREKLYKNPQQVLLHFFKQLQQP